MENKQYPLSSFDRNHALTELTKNGLDYVLLRRPKDSDPDGDIDILVEDVLKVNSLLIKLNYKCFSITANNAKYIRFNYEEQRWIHLDVQSNIKLKSFSTPNYFNKNILKTKILENGVYVLENGHELIITILHVGINKGFFDKEYYERVCSANLNELKKHILEYSFLPINLNELLVKIGDFCKEKGKEHILIDFLKNSFPDNQKTIKNFIYRVLNRIDSFFSLKRGVAILGPDGSGKSTLINPLSMLQWPSVKKQYMGPSSKASMNKWVYKVLIFITHKRDRYSKTHPIGIFFRISWVFVCYIDFLLRYFRYNWFYGSKGLVFFDRFPCDMYFRKPTKLNEIIFLKFFPKPKHVFLCVGDPIIIYERKKEQLSPKEVDDTLNLYREKLKKYNISFSEIDTTILHEEAALMAITEVLLKNKWFLYNEL